MGSDISFGNVMGWLGCNVEWRWRWRWLAWVQKRAMGWGRALCFGKFVRMYGCMYVWYARTYSKRRLRFFLSDVICSEKNLAGCMQLEVQKQDSRQLGSGSFGELGELIQVQAPPTSIFKDFESG